MSGILAEQVRSGLVETSHPGAVAVVNRDGSLMASHGEIDRPFFIRSSAKPFQATVSQEAGAHLDPLEMALACASHRGFPAHVSIVAAMLGRRGLAESMLQCPESWPLGEAAWRSVADDGAAEPRRIWHNCSGKHAGFLSACLGAGWPLESYLSPDHPLQRRVIELVTELGEYPVEPVGVDGCGAPVLRTTTRALALLFARLGTEGRFHEAFRVMHQYPALIGVNGAGDTEIAKATNGVAKGGAAGCLGVALQGRLGLAVKSWDGLGAVANLAAVAALEQLDALSPAAATALEPILRPTVLGGGAPVGRYQPGFRLEAT